MALIAGGPLERSLAIYLAYDSIFRGEKRRENREHNGGCDVINGSP